MSPLYAGVQLCGRSYCFLVAEGLLDEPDELRAEDRAPADERVLPPDERDPPTALDRGTDVRPELPRIELGERLVGALTDGAVPEVDEGARPYLEMPVGGTTTGRLTVDLPELLLGASSCRPPAVESEGAEVVGDERYTFGR